MRLLKTLIVFLLTVPALLFSEEIFVPFISDLSVERKGNLIRISWVDSPDIYGPVYIYRSSKPFDAPHPTLTGIKEIEIPYGTQFYIDELDNSQSMHYFIVSSAETGERYPILLPYRNSILVSAYDTNGDTAQHINVFSLDAFVRGDGVSISYRSIDNRKATILYRSNRPIRQKSDLVFARIVRLNVPIPFMDYPIPGLPYYYALVFAEDLEIGAVEIIPGYNATLEPVTLQASAPDIRVRGYDIVLPHLTMPNVIVHEMPQTIPSSIIALSQEAEQALASLFKERAAAQTDAQKEPQILQADFNAPTNSEEYVLYSIVHDLFAKHDWQKAQSELRAFTRLPQSAGLEMRARFYLGQIYFFSELFQDALLEFLAVRGSFPDETYRWIIRVLQAMVA